LKSKPKEPEEKIDKNDKAYRKMIRERVKSALPDFGHLKLKKSGA